jgi:CSLREA domain-containing protein
MSHNHSFKHSYFLSSPARLGLVLVLLMTTLGILPAPVARAADITVNTLLDNESDGCGSGNCTLREAITDATAGQEIDFSVTGTITLDSALPTITQDLTITGPGADVLAVSGDDTYRVFHITGGTVTISGLTITEGYADTDGGAGFYIASPAVVTITNCAITNNTLPNDTSLSGSGIYSDGDLTLERSTVSDNDATDNFGGGLFICAPSQSYTLPAQSAATAPIPARESTPTVQTLILMALPLPTTPPLRTMAILLSIQVA